MVKTLCFIASASLASAGFASYSAPTVSSFSTGASYSAPLASAYPTGAVISSPAVVQTSVEELWYPATHTQSQSMTKSRSLKKRLHHMPKVHQHVNTHVHQADVQNDKIIHNYQTSENKYMQAPGSEIQGSVSQVNHGNVDMGSIAYQPAAASSFSSSNYQSSYQPLEASSFSSSSYNTGFSSFSGI